MKEKQLFPGKIARKTAVLECGIDAACSSAGLALMLLVVLLVLP
jgi:hypothetical protein